MINLCDNLPEGTLVYITQTKHCNGVFVVESGGDMRKLFWRTLAWRIKNLFLKMVKHLSRVFTRSS
jgi:hypothetical protein